MPLGGLLIGGATSLLGGILGSSQAQKAAKAQTAAGLSAVARGDAATKTATDLQYAGISQANDAIHSGTNLANTDIANAGTAQKDIYGNMTGGLQPYQAAGMQGLNSLQSTAGTFKFDPSNLENDPGYQFQLQQGMKGLNNSMAARGLLQSGSALKATENYAQGLAGTSYQNAYNRALSTYNTNQQGYQSLANLGMNANSQNISAGSTYGGQLTSLANLGANTNMQGAGLLANTAMTGNENIANTTMQNAVMTGNDLMGVGNAQAAGAIGTGNAWSSALGGVGNAAQTYSLSKMLANPAVSAGAGAGAGTYV